MMKFDKESEGTYRYVLTPELYTKLAVDKVIEEASSKCLLPTQIITSAWNTIGTVIRSWATEGHAVPIPGLGTLRFALRARAVENVEDVASSLILRRRIAFVPSADIKEALAKVSIGITCYDRNGEVVRRVESVDGSDVDVEESDTFAGLNDSTEGVDTGGSGNGTDNTGNGGGKPVTNPLADE